MSGIEVECRRLVGFFGTLERRASVMAGFDKPVVVVVVVVIVVIGAAGTSLIDFVALDDTSDTSGGD